MKIRIKAVFLIITICLLTDAAIKNTSFIKIGFFLDYSGTMETSDTSRTGPNGTNICVLDYMQALGYTHVAYMLTQGNLLTFDAAAKKWQYNKSDYTSGSTVISFVNMKAAIESRGMKMVPGFECMSHVQWYISQDGSISEFPDSTSWKLFCNSIPGTSPARQNLTPANILLFNDIAFSGNYPTVKNPGMDAIVHEQLTIILKNWGTTALGGAVPEFILVNHDEIGNWGIPFVGHPLSVSGKTLAGISESTLLAREIAYRYSQIQTVFAAERGPAEIKMMIFGDCFSAEANGQAYHLASTLPNLKTDSAVRSMAPNIYKNLYVMPWIYSAPDNTWKQNWNNTLTYDKRNILQKFTSHGIKFIPCAGEDGPVDFNDKNWIANEIQSTFEWSRAAQIFHDYCYGYGVLHYNYFTAKGAHGVSGFTDPILAYLQKYPYIAKSYSSDPLTSINGTNYPVCPYYSGVFAGVNYQHARNNLSWTEGTDYTIGLALRQIGLKADGISASWNLPSFTQYTLLGSPKGTVSGTADNLLFAFREQNADFDARVRINTIPSGFKAGIMVRQDLTALSGNVHIYFDSGSPAAKVSHRDAASANTKIDPGSLSNATYARISRNNKYIYCYASTDGNSWTKLGQYAFGTGAVMIGVTSSSSNNNSGSVVFSNLSFK